MKRKIKCSFLLIFLIIAFLFISISSYASTVSESLQNNFFRLHIIANSDSASDQELKLKIRDKVMEYMKSQNISNLSKNEISDFLKNNLSELDKIINSVLQESNKNDSVSLEIGNFYFPTKHYGNISLPAGFYDGLKISIGEAKGQNWWCSLFPPLCFVDISSGIIDEDSMKNLEKNLTEEEFAIITDNSENVKLKFKILELF